MRNTDLDSPLHPEQATVFASTARFRSVCAPHGWGRTRLAIDEMVRACSIPAQSVVYVAQTPDLLRVVIWDDIKAALGRVGISSIHEPAMKVRMLNGSMVKCIARNFDSLRGISQNFVVVDGMEAIDPDVWTRVLHPSLSSTGGSGIMLGADDNATAEHEVGDDWEVWSFGRAAIELGS